MKLLAFFLALFVAAPLHAQAPVAPAAPAPATAESKWEKDIAAFEKADAEKPPVKGGILFTGSSSIRMWKSLEEDFPKHRVVNRGFGGSQIADSTGFAERYIFPHEPRLIVLYAGGNDINAKKTPDQVVADFRAFVAKVRAKLPDTEIAYISVAPNPARWGQLAKIKEVNRRIEEITQQEKGLHYIDVFSRMLGTDGLPHPDIFLPDRLHMNEKGYAIWKKVVAPFLGKPDEK